MPYGYGLLLKINSFPFKPYNLAPAQSIESGNYNTEFNKLAFYGLKKFLKLLCIIIIGEIC